MRRQTALTLTLVAVVASAGVGWVAGDQVRSSDDAAADAGPPTPSRITVPVERRALTADLVLRGDIGVAAPLAITLAGGVGEGDGGAGASPVVTVAPEVGDELVDGQPFAQVSGRPILTLLGAQPMYRTITPGATGDDVAQLEEALARLGFDPGPLDGVYDDAAEAAVDAWYASVGFTSQGPSDSERDQLSAARDGVASAQSGVRAAEQALSEGAGPPTAVERLEADQGVRQAEDALATARSESDASAQRLQAAIDAATVSRDAARQRRDDAVADRDTARTELDAARAGAVDPSTGVPYTTADIAELQAVADAAASTLAQAEGELAGAEAMLTSARADQTAGVQSSAASVRAAEDALDLAQARRSQLLAPRDAGSLRSAVSDARAALGRAQDDLAELEAQIGTEVPSGEVVFVPTAPLRVEVTEAQAGAAVPTPFVTVSGGRLTVTAAISTSDRDLLAVDDRVVVEATDYGVELEGAVERIADGPGTDGADEGHVRVWVALDDPDAAREYTGAAARVTVPIGSTGGEAVLAVPVAALSLTAAGGSRLEVEEADGTVRTVGVTPGLSADGYVQVEPEGDATLEEGDRVVVGTASSATGDEGDDDEGDDDETDDTGADSRAEGVG
jgi:peptidoglycan hydrolase-like protein with peptidoglycan-binding domain